MRATDEILGRSVAVRIFTPGSGHVTQVMAAALAASRVSDPRLARIFDADDRADPPLIVTEWPSGTCLTDLLTAGPLDPSQAARVFAEAADALATAHQAGLAHLCLSPESLWCGTSVLAVLAGGGWLAVREVTATHRPSGAGPAVAAQALTPVSAAAFGPMGTATATTRSLRGSLSTVAPRWRGTRSGTPPPASGT
jgi:serine/threonine protein kinase